MNTTLQTRIDAKLKREAKKTLENMGLDLSTGIKIFLTHVVRTGTIPFTISSFDTLSDTQKRALLKEAKTALKTGERFSTIHDAHNEILGH